MLLEEVFLKLRVTKLTIERLQEKLRQTTDPAEKWAIGVLLAEEGSRHRPAGTKTRTGAPQAPRKLDTYASPW
jgi:hypothetical protein